jgi:uncharacterized paraquat-inducible protein A
MKRMNCECNLPFSFLLLILFSHATPVISHSTLKITSSAVLATTSKPMKEKNTTADPASIPFTPNGKYLSNQRENKRR